VRRLESRAIGLVKVVEYDRKNENFREFGILLKKLGPKAVQMARYLMGEEIKGASTWALKI